MKVQQYVAQGSGAIPARGTYGCHRLGGFFLPDVGSGFGGGGFFRAFLTASSQSPSIAICSGFGPVLALGSCLLFMWLLAKSEKVLKIIPIGLDALDGVWITSPASGKVRSPTSEHSVAEKAIPVHVIEERLRAIDVQIAHLDELRRTRDWLSALLSEAVEFATAEELSPEEETSVTAQILELIRDFPDLQSGAIARVLQTKGVNVQTKVVQTIIGQQVKKGTLRRSPDGRFRVRQ